MRSLIQIYALAVCFCSLMCFVVASGVGLYDALRIAMPRFTLAPYAAAETNEKFLALSPGKAHLPETELTRLREEYNQESSDQERHAGAQSIAFAGIIAVIDAVVFGVHWSIAKRSERPLSPLTISGI